MRCRPGDLAVIVKEEPGCRSNVGRFVTVIDDELCEGDEWHVISNSSLMAFNSETDSLNLRAAGTELWIADNFLQPIRSQPDDALDESLTWKQVPRTNKETA